MIGHRGAAGDRPENTLPAFVEALAQGAAILESDVQATRDGVPVLLHDETLERTTDGRGPAAGIDWSELRRLDAARHFVDEKGETSLRGRGIGIPSLEAAFDAFPEARFNLELKTGDPRALATTLELVARPGRSERTLLTAGEDDVMRALRSALATHRAAPALGAALGEIVAAVQAAVAGGPMPDGVMALQIPPSFGGRPLVTRALVDYAHAHDVHVHVWTINDLDEIAALLALGADGIVTDHPGRMARWLERHERS